MENFKIILRLFLILLLVGFHQDNLTFDHLKNFNIGEYQLQAPENFKLTEQQGYDSMVGIIEGSGITLSYDYGMYTSPEQNVSEEDYTIINEDNEGIQKQILIAKNPRRDNTSIHISIAENPGPNNPLPFKIWGTNLTDRQQELAIKIFNSITVERQDKAQSSNLHQSISLARYDIPALLFAI
jgi:hypothetical protein